ncbi:hypothetical protein CQ14_01845 [Bradyrhizobium lablabi]|uniref:DUF1326 domain-containing protein n=1 Tax=Bradyrhizobium lablabi TaxID=722472 RepID=A0A0R3N2U8_9BRAD|nr:DUF1326 domain-containing protein [Bradyrhizobium lablabi]KRR26282.1 hypothetical protein CQ14_01845 [Bradyrhizobium lablabi]
MTKFSRRHLLDIAGSFTAASILSALRPVRVAQAAEEKSAWNVKGRFMESCNCEAMCPCVVGNAPTVGMCTVLLGYHIETGRKGDVTLDGLNVVRMNFSPSHMTKGNWRGAFYIDERANPAQREALSAIFSFKPGGAFAAQAGMVAEVLGVKFVPITFESKGRQWKLAIAGIGDADIAAIEGRDGKEISVENLRAYGFPIVAAKSTHTAYKDFDLQWEISGKSGFYSTSFAFSSA